MSFFDEPSTSSSQRNSQPTTCPMPMTLPKYRSRLDLTAQEQMEKLVLKNDYMNLLEEVNAIDNNSSVNQSIKKISQVVEKADQLFSKVKDSTEMYLDAKVMQSATNVLETTANNIDVGEGNFNPLIFADQFKIKAVCGQGEAAWEALMRAAPPVVHNSLPSWSPLLGSFDFSGAGTPSPQKKPRQVRPRDAETVKKEPEKVIQLDKSQKGAEEMVQMIFSKLKKCYKNNNKKPINYFRFVLDPNSFAASVENIFYLSFLVNDGHVKLEVENNELFISPYVSGKENSHPQSREPTGIKKQNIISLDMRTWRELLSVLEIEHPMI